jgi:putative IMPACT (imprinted ancient) family translation regulator
MPYYIYIVTSNESSNSRSVTHVNDHESYKQAKTEIRRLRGERPLAENQIYKIIFAKDLAEAEKSLKEVREEPIAREWEK